MNAAKVTLTSTILAAALGLALALTAAPAEAKPRCDDPPCKGGGNVSNPDDFQAECDELFNLPAGSCNVDPLGNPPECLFDVNVGIANGNPVMKISLIQNCTTDTMLVLPNFLDPGLSNPNFPELVAEFASCNVVDPVPDCPSSDTNTFLDGRGFVLTAVGDFSGDAVITNSTDHGEIVDITIAIAASNAGCDDGSGNFLESAINIDLTGKPPVHDPPRHTWIRILGTTVMVTEPGAPLCYAIVMQHAPAKLRTTTIVHDSTVEPEAYTDVGTLFRDLRFGSDTLGNIGVGSSTIGRPSGALGTAVEFDDVDMAEIANNTIENEMNDGTDVVGTGVLVVRSEEFTIKLNTIKGGDVGIEVVGPGTDGLISKNTIVGDGFEGDEMGTVGILCVSVDPGAITIRKNNSVIDYDTLIDC